MQILPIVRLELYNKESSFFVSTNLLKQVLVVFKNHFKYQFKILSCISALDYPENCYRFRISYELLSTKFNSRLRGNVLVDEFVPINSVEKIFSAASWYENEIWDLFGVFFIDHKNLMRLLTDYGFQGYPLRKDFGLNFS